MNELVSTCIQAREGRSRHPPPSHHHQPVPLLVCLSIIVVGSVLAIGAVHLPSVAIIAILALACFCLTLHDARQYPMPPVRPAWIFFALAGVCVLQAVPLPAGLVRAIAPANADIWTRAMHPFGEGAASWLSLSLDPGATWGEALRWSSYGMVFTASASWAYRRNARFGVTLVFLSALLASLVTLSHGLVGAERVFGLYEPSFKPSPWYLGPLLNPNNFAGYTNLGALCGLGLLLATKPIAPRWTIAIAVALILGINVTSASRGGVLLLLIGLASLALTVEFTRQRRAQSKVALRRSRMVLSATVAFGVALATLGASRQTWSALYDDKLDKLILLRDVVPLVRDHPWFGVGRGAFESAFPAYQKAFGGTVYTHAENFLAQWLAEWGLPITIIAVIAFARAFRPSRMGVGGSTINAGAYIGVMILLLHNMVDLGLEIPALCLAASVVLGTLWGDARRIASLNTEPQPLSLRSFRLATGAATITVLVGIGMLAHHGWTDVAADRLSLSADFRRAARPRSPAVRQALRKAIRLAVSRHPAEPYFPLIAASLAWQERDAEPMPWIQRSLERSLVNGKAHLLLAHLLTKRGARSQAQLEVRLAVSADPTLVSNAAPLGATLLETKEDLAALVPAGEQGTIFVDLLAETLKQRGGNEKLVALVDKDILTRDPMHVRAHGRRVAAMTAKVKNGKPCPNCEADVEGHLATIAQIETTRSTGDRLRAGWLLARGQANAAEKLLAKRCEVVDDIIPCLTKRAAIATELDDPKRFLAASRALLAAACIDAPRCAHLVGWIGDLHRKAGRHGAALTAYRRACREAPSHKTWMRLGDAAAEFGMYAEAIEAYRKARRFATTDDPDITERIEKMRRQLGRRLLR